MIICSIIIIIMCMALIIIKSQSVSRGVKQPIMAITGKTKSNRIPLKGFSVYMHILGN